MVDVPTSLYSTTNYLFCLILHACSCIYIPDAKKTSNVAFV